MNDDINTRIHIIAQNDASPAILKAAEDLKKLAASAARLAGIRVETFSKFAGSGLGKEQLAAMAGLRQRLAFEGRMSRQREGEAREEQRRQDAIDRAAMRGFREKMAFASRIHAQRMGEERDAERERDRHHRDAMRRSREAYGAGRGAVRDTVRTTGTAAIAGTLGTAAAARRALGVESAIDAAEINTRSYAGLSADMARKLRDGWAAPLAEALGSGTDKLLTAWTDAVKLGIPAEGAKGFAELATKTSSAWEVPFERVTDIMGTVNTLLTSGGDAFDIEKLKSVSNTLQHLAAKQSTTPEKMISFLQRGAGAAQVLGMSQEAGLAFGSASTSLGNQAGASGRLFDYVASRLIELPRLTRKDGDEGRQARQLLSALGYGSASNVEAKRRADPDGFLPDFMDRFNRIKDKKKQDEAIRFFAGREWLGEFGRMVKGVDTYREAVRLSKEAKGFDAISQVWDLHRLKLSFVFKQFKAGWQNILGEFGKELSPLARQAGDFFLGWADKLRQGGLSARFRAALDGMIEGFGFKNFPDLLKNVFGEPGKGDAGSIAAWRDTFREFAAGLKDVFTGIRDAISALAGGSPEVIARWTGRVLALTAALVILSPVIGVIGTLASALIAIGAAVVAVSGSLRAAGLMGGAAGIAGAAGAKGKGLGMLGRAFGLVGAAELAQQFGALKLPDAKDGIGRFLLEALDPGLARRLLGPRKGSTWQDPPAKVQKSAIDAKPDAAVMQKASFERIERSLRGVDDNLRRSSGLIQLAALGNGGGIVGAARAFGGSATSGGLGGSGAGALENAVPGERLSSFGMGRSGIIRRGAMGGLGSGSATAVPDSVPMTAAERNTLGLILKYESGGKNQMNYMGKSQGLDPTTAKGYTAQGYYQMLNSNWRRIAPKLGINTPNAMASSLEDQTRVALHLLRNGGIGNWANYNPKLRGALARGEQAPTGTVANVGGNSQAVVNRSGAAAAVDIAKQYNGLHEVHDNAKLSGFMKTQILGAQNAWCADFVNSSLRAVGVKGTGSRVANSFLGWGSNVEAKNVMKGDVLVEHRGRGINQSGGHVGLATGNTRMNPRTGELEIESIQGNTSNKVRTEWERASKLAIRRANESQAVVDKAKEAGGGMFASDGWKPGAGGNAAALGQAGKPATDPDRMLRSVPSPMRDGQGSGIRANSGRMHAPITIQGGNQDPQQIALAVQRHLNDTMTGRSHDIDYQTT